MKIRKKKFKIFYYFHDPKIGDCHCCFYAKKQQCCR